MSAMQAMARSTSSLVISIRAAGAGLRRQHHNEKRNKHHHCKNNSTQKHDVTRPRWMLTLLVVVVAGPEVVAAGELERRLHACGRRGQRRVAVLVQLPSAQLQQQGWWL
eukprot:m.256458 g.256458  ORF g.256458 m.256458 type:complete len:109 (+) comp19171_c4_seq7:199-525(+)